MLYKLSLAVLVFIYVAASPSMHMTIKYVDDDNNTVPLNVLVDQPNQVIYLTVPSGQNTTDGDTLEDYKTGYMATLIRSVSKCNIRMLPRGLSNQIAYYKEHDGDTTAFTLGTRVSLVPEDHLPKLGERITTFCNGTELYDCISPRRHDFLIT